MIAGYVLVQNRDYYTYTKLMAYGGIFELKLHGPEKIIRKISGEMNYKVYKTKVSSC